MSGRTGRLAAHLASPIGRLELANGVVHRVWPALGALAQGYRRLAARTELVAVTGSLGKTTTARAVRAALGLRREADQPNCYHHLALSVLGLPPWARRAVLEVGIQRPGEMALYARLLRPNTVVMTAVASEHARALGGLEGIAREKAALVRAVPASGLVVLNGDDRRVRAMAGLTAARVVTFGFGPENDVRALEWRLDWPRGSRLVVQAEGRSVELRARLLGRHQAPALLAAVAVARAAGLELEAIRPRLEALPPTPHRLQPIRLPSGAWLIADAHKASRESIEAALDLLAEIPAERRIVVLGDATDLPAPVRAQYRALGARLAGVANLVVLCGLNAGAWEVGARRAGLPAEAIWRTGRDPLRAVELLRDRLRPGDVVLVKGRQSERLERVGLALAGRPVRCGLTTCQVMLRRCDVCPMVARGWEGLPTPW